jgi:16S rRNA (guanine966-N2)-methyltransferase
MTKQKLAMKPSKQRSIDSQELARRRKGQEKFAATRLRIVAGSLGGRKITYNGDPVTRPMKERTRESVFSLLGGYLYGTFAIDLFGGTGILAMESVSRGAERAIVLELSRPAVSTLVSNLKELKLDERIEVFNVDTLRWLRNLPLAWGDWPKLPWIVFCCPPYRLWEAESERLCAGISELFAASPPGSQFICETDGRFDLAAAMPQLDWDVRTYSPAIINVCRKT